MTEFIDVVSIDQFPSLRFSVYQIPTADVLSIKSTEAISLIQIYNQLGQLVLAGFNQNKINVSSLENGFYF